MGEKWNFLSGSRKEPGILVETEFHRVESKQTKKQKQQQQQPHVFMIMAALH